MKLAHNHMLQGLPLFVCHGVGLGTDRHHSDLLAELPNVLLVQWREAMRRNEIKADINQQIIPAIPQMIALRYNALHKNSK